MGGKWNIAGVSEGHLGGDPALTLDSDWCFLDLLGEAERKRAVPKLEGEALVVSENIRVAQTLTTFSQ